ncbi:MAG: hypothetical protein J0H43_14820 [Actinobacteria bacterium]|nr:hypothetical protein [Actinomycetota bacterium]
MADSRRGLAPWITAGIAGACLCALVVVYFVIFRDDQRHADATRALVRSHVFGQLNDTETAAMGAAATEIVNLQSFRRASFAADYQRAVDGTTGALKSDVVSKKQATEDALTKGKFDTSAKIVSKALSEQANSGKTPGYVILVVVDGYRSNLANVPVQSTLAVTVLDIGGKWLASDVTSVGIAG